MCFSFQANVEMRKRLQKQQSLPAEPQRSRLRESIMAVTRSKQFESLKAGISSLVGGEPKKQPSLPEEPEDSPKPETGEGEGDEGKVGEGGDGDEKVKRHLPKHTAKTSTAATTSTTTTTQVGTATIGSGIVRIWQSLSQVLYSVLNLKFVLEPFFI